LQTLKVLTVFTGLYAIFLSSKKLKIVICMRNPHRRIAVIHILQAEHCAFRSDICCYFLFVVMN